MKLISFIMLAFILLGACNKTIGRGLRGRDGAPGVPGQGGDDGLSCNVQTVEPGLLAPNGGALITCGYTSSLLINGAPGADGQDGDDGAQGETGLQGPEGQPSAYSIVDVINPCGVNGAYEERFLRLANGTVIASFSANMAGDLTRLTELTTGSFVTSDGFACAFNSVINNDGTGSISWDGGGVSW